MLLTQSQVSVVVSLGVVVVFTFFLFLSGYVIQQRTVASLQQTIKPRLPPPPPTAHGLASNSIGASLQTSRLFRRDGSHIAYLDFQRARENSINVDWTRLAHVQLVRNHHDVCNSVMILADLHRLKSPGRRVLLFPSAWTATKPPVKGAPKDPYMDSTRRLLRLAARRYGVELRPIEPLMPVGVSKDNLLETQGHFSLASAFALTDFDRVLNIETPGLILDASPLDAVLAFTEPVPFAMLHDTTEGDGVHAQNLQLLQPSTDTHSRILALANSIGNFSDTQIAEAFSDPLLLDSSSNSSALIRSIGTLHQPDITSEMNRTAFLSDVAYLRFSDPKLPGPEYDVPWSDKLAARPKNKDADWIWTKMYTTFAQKRVEVCGLDLETWRP